MGNGNRVAATLGNAVEAATETAKALGGVVTRRASTAVDKAKKVAGGTGEAVGKVAGRARKTAAAAKTAVATAKKSVATAKKTVAGRVAGAKESLAATSARARAEAEELKRNRAAKKA